jgi:NAD(P)-dependent dehydrogenase (short-subunit alcohol dehydrogenase family)
MKEDTMTGKLDGKVAVISGGSAGIGLATAKRFVAEGAYVFITGRRQAELDAAVKEIGANVTGLQGDAAILSDLDSVYAAVKAEKGRIDILFANAGVYETGTLGEISESHFDKIFDVNVRGLLFTVQKALPLMVDGGAIILTGSIGGSKGFPSFSVYDASKAAVRSFARGWTVDLKTRHIRVNVISPGTIATPGLDVLVDEESRKAFLDIIPMGRIGEADEIAKSAVFLACDDSSFITGIELFVDGGTAQV